MKIYSVFCKVEVDMHYGQPYSARMYTAIETKSGEKEYWRTLSTIEAGIAMRKLEKYTGVKTETNYNRFDPYLTHKQSIYYREG